MANNYYHAFDAKFSFVVLFTLLAMFAVAYIIGRLSVRLVPRKTPKKKVTLPEDAPKYEKTKARTLAKMYKKAGDKAEYESTAVIMFRSNAFDVFVAAIGVILFDIVFISEHYDGLVQWCINHLTSSDSAAWGDIVALMAITFISFIICGIVYVIVRLGEFHKANYYAKEFIAEKVRPVFNEHRSIVYFINMFIYCVKEDAKEKRAKAEPKREANEMRNANLA